MKLMNKPIEMVCIFSKDGKVTPFKMRLEDDTKKEKLYTVTPLSVDRSRTLHNYRCSIESNGEKENCIIHYYVSECKWVLYSIK